MTTTRTRRRTRLTSVRLVETFRTLFYTPMYVGLGGGFFYRRGLNVSLSTMPLGGSTMEMLRDGEADIAQTGISRSLVELDEGREDAPLHFAEINQRDGFFLVAKEPADVWSWKSLEGARLAPIVFTPVPGQSLLAAMMKEDFDASAVDLVSTVSLEESMKKFVEGDLDCAHLPHPMAAVLEEAGVGYVVAAIGKRLGELCFSSFAAAPGYIESNESTVQAFVDGFADALNWLTDARERTVLELVAPFFPFRSQDVIIRCIREYREVNTWPSAPDIARDKFDAMRDLLIDGGMVQNAHPYERLVLPKFAASSANNLLPKPYR